MAISAVPYALQNASHPANLFRQAVASLLPPGGGVVNATDFAVAQTGTPSMAVQVGVGRIWIPGTEVSNVSGGTFSSQAMYYAENDAATTLTIATANASNPRIDVVYVSVQDAAYSGSLNQANLGVITGVPAPSPSVPAIPNNAISLAQVAVAANASSITTTNITASVPSFNNPTIFPLTLSGSYVPRASGYGTPGIYRNGNRAYLTGSATLSGSATWTAGTQNFLAVTPSSYAPAANVDFPLMFRNTGTAFLGYITVDHTGTVSYILQTGLTSSNVTISLEGISWVLPW